MLKLYGSIQDMRIDEICRTFYGCQVNEFEIIKASESEPGVNIKHDKPAGGKAVISVSQDKMSIAVSLFPAINGESKLSYEKLSKIIYDDNRISKDALSEEYLKSLCGFVNDDFIIDNLKIEAQGTPITKVENKINLFFELPSTKPIPQNEGKADFKQLNLYVTVKKGHLLAKIIPAFQVIKNIFGEETPLPPVNKYSVTAGDGVVSNPDGTEFYADADGYIEYAGNRLSIKSQIEIQGNVDYSIGNIDFPGDILIKGDVMPGFAVKGKNIKISGTCQDASIVASENIQIDLGIIGSKLNHRSIITAGQDITAGFCDSSNLYAGNNIFIKKYAFNCSLNSGGYIEALGGSSVAGGEIRTFAGGSFYNIGTKTNTAINIYLGKKYDMQEKVNKMKAEKTEMYASIEKIDLVLNKLNMNDKQLLENPKVAKLLETRRVLMKQVEIFMKKIDEVIKENHPDPVIKIKNEIVEGAVIQFYEIRYYIKENTKFIEFYLDNANFKVESRPYKA